MKTDFRIGWSLFCRGEEFEKCVNEDQRRGWMRAYTQSEGEL